MRDKELEQRKAHADRHWWVGLIFAKTSYPRESFAASEVFRHIDILTSGQEVKQETRGFDEEKAETFSLRSKEDAPDYRYMPDPNIPPLLLTEVTHMPHPRPPFCTEKDVGVY